MLKIPAPAEGAAEGAAICVWVMYSLQPIPIPLQRTASASAFLRTYTALPNRQKGG
jgi:hypothetical protein